MSQPIAFAFNQRVCHDFDLKAAHLVKDQEW